MSTIQIDRSPRAARRTGAPAVGGARDRASLWIARRVPVLIFGLLAAVGFTPFVLSAIRTAQHHQVFLGVAGVYPFDQDQYLAFVASAHDGLIRNLYGLTGSAVFVDPVWSPSGIVQGLTGLGSATIMAFWNVVGTGVLFAGAWRLVSRHIPASQPWRRNAALLLALFGGMTLLAGLGRPQHVLIYASVGLDMVPAQTLWGYAPMAIAIGLMPFAIEGMERIVDGRDSRRCLALTAVACLLVGWLHPWQGATLFIIWLGLNAWRIGEGRGLRSGAIQLLLITVALLAAPVYFEILPRIDASWAGFSKADAAGFAISWQYLVLAFGPAALVAVPGALQLRSEVRARGLVLWPLAVMAIVAARPPETMHSFDGVALPLAVLTLVTSGAGLRLGERTRSVLAWLRAGWAGFALLSAVVITVALVGLTQNGWESPLSGIRRDDLRAARLAARHAGDRPILTTQQLGVQLPIVTDRAAWAGDAFWTPDARGRELATDRFFLGNESASAGRAFVATTGALAIVEPCGWHFNLSATLASSRYATRTVGCAHVYWRR